MYLVTLVDDGVLELNWTWFPTFIGLDIVCMESMQKALNDQFVGRVVDQALLHEAHRVVVDFLVGYYPNVENLREVLDAPLRVSYRNERG